MSVLFLDDDNAARAPLAEALFVELARGQVPVYAAAWTPSHVRKEVREVLEEDRVRAGVLRARSIGAVPMDEVDVVVAFVPDQGRLRLRPNARRIDWKIPDPTAAPAEERMEAYRAARDEIRRRVELLLREIAA